MGRAGISVASSSHTHQQVWLGWAVALVGCLWAHCYMLCSEGQHVSCECLPSHVPGAGVGWGQVFALI